MLNKNRGDFAYTVLDVDNEVSANVIDDIKKINGILRVRKIVK